VSALEEHLLDALEPETQGTDEQKSFVIDDNGAADWALRKIAQKQRLIAENEELAEREIARIREWLTDANGPLQNEIANLELLLTDYHRRLLAEDDRRKTVKLPAGNLKARKLPDNVEVTDEDAFIEWAEAERHTLLRITTAPDKNAIKQAVLKDGEVIPHVAAVKGDLKFSIDINGKDDAV
jgi:phage host-nuclease inhibitor protein Gam